MNEPRTLTGWHVAAIFGAFFGTIITVNLMLAYSAVSTFPGIEVKNSYVASQTFDARREQQEALGWNVYAQTMNGGVSLEIKDARGAPVEVNRLYATLGRATHVKDDQSPIFTFNGHRYEAPAKLAPGYWNLRMRAYAADGTPFEQRIELFVKG
ncbi:FixH family protein [Primorskyibacter sp. S187A]|uniref:FixH family protein n=1 Tax=Primorskyibacter sp. S187A TaxID=3415130 RepID=UPI003C7A87C4